MQNAGACKIADFGVELFTRQIESERQCSATAPGLDSASTSIERNILHKHTTPSSYSYSYTDPNQIRSAWDYRRRATMPACSRTRTLRRWLHRCLTWSIRQTVRRGYRCRARSSSRCPCSHSPARRALWLSGHARRIPRPAMCTCTGLPVRASHPQSQCCTLTPTLRISTEDASTLVYRKGESRCILIASGLGPRAHMYAHIKPCDSKQASGILTVAAAAAPPPPPGATTVHYYDPLRVSNPRLNQHKMHTIMHF